MWPDPPVEDPRVELETSMLRFSIIGIIHRILGVRRPGEVAPGPRPTPMSRLEFFEQACSILEKSANSERVNRREKDLRGLIRHAWVHSGYRDCGYKQMTTEQKKLYCEINEQDFVARQEFLVLNKW